MNIAVKGKQARLEELRSVLSSGQSVNEFKSSSNFDFSDVDVIFDLDFDDDPSSIGVYEGLGHCTIFLNCVKVQLESVVSKGSPNIIGINGMETFIGRPMLEACSPFGEMPVSMIKELGFNDVNRVKSRVGLVSPRIVFMIINEAYFTRQEGTAGEEDIDNGMKLGTAYPMGPFEWCRKTGIANVYETLLAIAEDTGSDRYKICPLLKTEYLNSGIQDEAATA